MGDILSVGDVFLLIVLAIPLYAWWYVGRESDKRARGVAAIRDSAAEEFSSILTSRHGFANADCYFSPRHDGIAYDPGSRRIALAHREATGLQVEVFHPRQIRRCSIAVDGESIVEAAPGSSAATRAMVGGLLFGGAGAVAGAATAKQRVTPTIRSIELRVVVDDPLNPARNILFFAGGPVEAGLARVLMRQANSDPEKWCDRLSVLMDASTDTDSTPIA